MKRIVGISLFIAAAMMVMVGCAGHAPKQPLPDFSPQHFDTDMYTLTYDNVLFILDGSSSMEEKCKGHEKIDIAREVMTRLNQTMPEMGQKVGLRTFGHNSSVSTEATVMQYGMEEYSTEGLAQGVAKLNATGGNSFLFKALKEAENDLGGLSGQTAVVIVSDGKDMPPKTADAAQALKEKLGSAICFYPVVVGEDAEGMKLMQQVSKAGGCGFFSEASNLMSSDAMANFVKNVFLKEAPKPVEPPVAKIDSDNDGVPDDLDKCPDTPAGVEVDADGCPLDSDGDGVPDYLDKCPGTPAGAKVNPMGCWVLGDLLFDFDRAVIKAEGHSDLEKVFSILQKNPNMNIVLQGHTDSIGSDSYNKRLSLRRAKAVKAYLVGKGISEGRLKCEGYGESKPAASNKTDFGRSLNRRVQLMPVM